MQRQSLGSPSTKLHLHEEQKQQPIFCISSSSPTTNNIKSLLNGEEEDVKKLKLKKPNSNNNTTPESYIHLIPILTLLCFLILYLSSHNPSQNDLDQFNVFNHLHNPSDLVENISEFERVVEIKKEDLLTIRSLKNIKHGRLHRKFLLAGLARAESLEFYPTRVRVVL